MCLLEGRQHFNSIVLTLSPDMQPVLNKCLLNEYGSWRPKVQKQFQKRTKERIGLFH